MYIQTSIYIYIFIYYLSIPIYTCVRVCLSVCAMHVSFAEFHFTFSFRPTHLPKQRFASRSGTEFIWVAHFTLATSAFFFPTKTGFSRKNGRCWLGARIHVFQGRVPRHVRVERIRKSMQVHTTFLRQIFCSNIDLSFLLWRRFENSNSQTKSKNGISHGIGYVRLKRSVPRHDQSWSDLVLEHCCIPAIKHTAHSIPNSEKRVQSYSFAMLHSWKASAPSSRETAALFQFNNKVHWDRISACPCCCATFVLNLGPQ